MSRPTINNQVQLLNHIRSLELDDVFLSHGSIKTASELNKINRFIKDSSQDNRSIVIIRSKD